MVRKRTGKKQRRVETEWGPMKVWPKLGRKMTSEGWRKVKRKRKPYPYPISEKEALHSLKLQMKIVPFGKTRGQEKNGLRKQWTTTYYNEEISEFTYKKVMEEIEKFGRFTLKKR